MLEEIVLLRHGETAWNVQRRMQGHRDIRLSDVGLAQAVDSAPTVAAMGPDVVVSSDLQRASATADVVAAVMGATVRRDERLRETAMGRWEGLTREDIAARWPGDWERWRSTGASVAPPGGESRVQVAARASEVVDELDAGPARRALLVSHGGLIVGLTGHLLGLPKSEWTRLEGVGNCHWVVLHRRGAWRLNTYNGGLGGLVLPSSDDDVVDD